jgi:hypothetical protein
VARLRQGPAVDLVLMDMQMPELDGDAATRCIRGELGLAKLPVLALTAGALKAEQQRALDAGMNEFITKPLNPMALIRAVRQHVERVSGCAVPLVPRQEGGARPVLPAWPHIEGIDGREVAQRLSGDVTEPQPDQRTGAGGGPGPVPAAGAAGQPGHQRRAAELAQRRPLLHPADRGRQRVLTRRQARHQREQGARDQPAHGREQQHRA